MASIYNSALVLGDLQLNYLWPQYSLPWNNFNTRVQPNPFYLQNQLRNIAIAEVSSPHIFKSNPIVDSADGVLQSGIPVPSWAEIIAAHSLEQTSTAQKVFVGPYVDISKNISGLEYQYDYAGKLIHTSPNGLGNFVYLVLNLDNRNPSTVNFPAYVQPIPGTPVSACAVGDAVYNFSTLTGSITAASVNSCASGTTICLDDALPIGTCAAACTYTAATTAFYYINGNRLYIAASNNINPTKCTGCSDVSLQTYHIKYAVTVRVVETTTPLQKALNPLAPFPAPIL